MSYDQEQALRDLLEQFRSEHRIRETIQIELSDAYITIDTHKKWRY